MRACASSNQGAERLDFDRTLFESQGPAPACRPNARVNGKGKRRRETWAWAGFRRRDGARERSCRGPVWRQGMPQSILAIHRGAAAHRRSHSPLDPVSTITSPGSVSFKNHAVVSSACRRNRVIGHPTMAPSIPYLGLAYFGPKIQIKNGPDVGKLNRSIHLVSFLLFFLLLQSAQPRLFPPTIQEGPSW